MTATEYVVLVDENDNQTGIAEKLAAHEQNLLHRAFSVFLFRESNDLEVLLQQRALSKYHSPGLWTNTCCSHPREGEDIIAAGERRLFEELGVKAGLRKIGVFHYNAHFDNGLSENEVDHVLIGFLSADLEIHPNPEEVEAVRWVTTEQLKEELKTNPHQFTPWLQAALDVVKKEFSHGHERKSKNQR